MVLISDLMDKQGYETACGICVSQQMDVYVIQVLSAEELDPDVQGRPAAGRLRGRATWPRSRSAPLLEALPETLAAFVDGAREFCNRRGMAYLLAKQPGAGRSAGLELPAASGGWCADVAAMDQHALAAGNGLPLLAVPPAIVLLYFLKLKRQPLEVPSTYLWHKSIEDLHVNSIWQRLRQSLLLFLQLLLVAVGDAGPVAARLASGSKLTGDRFIFLVDNSASMGATDVAAHAAGRSQAPRSSS